MSVSLSPPVRVAALVAALALTGIAAFLFLLGRGASTAGGSAAPVAPISRPVPDAHTRVTPKRHSTSRATHPRKRIAIVSGLPNPVAHALRYSRVVVVAIYVPGAQVDAFVRGEARAAARLSRAGYVGISASSENALQRLVAKTGVLPDPAVVIIRRPGSVEATLSVVDRETIAQAVLQAKAAR